VLLLTRLLDDASSRDQGGGVAGGGGARGLGAHEAARDVSQGLAGKHNCGGGGG